MNAIKFFLFLLLFSTIQGMEEQLNFTSLPPDLLIDIIEYAIENKNLFIKRGTLHKTAQSCKQLQKFCVKIINKKENKETIKYIFKAHDWVSESLLYSTDKKCCYGTKKIKKDDGTEEIIGYLIERKEKRIRNLHDLNIKLAADKRNNNETVKTLNDIIDVINKRKIFFDNDDYFLGILKRKILQVKQEQLKPSLVHLSNFFYGASSSSFIYLVFQDPLFTNYDNFKMSIGVSALISLWSLGLSLGDLMDKQNLHLHKDFQKKLNDLTQEVPHNRHFVVPSISLSRYEKFLHRLEAFPDEVGGME
jgi:hypothetical protein